MNFKIFLFWKYEIKSLKTKIKTKKLILFLSIYV